MLLTLIIITICLYIFAFLAGEDPEIGMGPFSFLASIATFITLVYIIVKGIIWVVKYFN